MGLLGIDGLLLKYNVLSLQESRLLLQSRIKSISLGYCIRMGAFA